MESRATLFLVAISTTMAVALLWPADARAHVLVANESNTIGAVLHITPDDDPVAGESADIFFDIQAQKFSDDSYVPTLAVVDGEGKEQIVSIQKNGSYINASYTFPARGVYVLRLSIKHQESKDIFSVTQRVSRGVRATDNPSGAVRHQWAEILVVATLSGGCVLLIIFATRLGKIVKHSQ